MVQAHALRRYQKQATAKGEPLDDLQHQGDTVLMSFGMASSRSGWPSFVWGIQPHNDLGKVSHWPYLAIWCNKGMCERPNPGLINA